MHVTAIFWMIIANILMIRYFVLSMQENGAAKATVQNFAVNYLASVFIGWYLFKEVITIKLIVGIVLILAGTLLIAMGSDDWNKVAEDDSDKKETKIEAKSKAKNKGKKQQ